ncbi:sugar ABC transporter substrate-binding protein [Paenibacillus algorifonticola]|uniref:ABC transporter substrate-binding protein n=1 Tax=Paenibacillus algorifonticola TaxID=684063 RepID=UPI003D2C4255
MQNMKSTLRLLSVGLLALAVSACSAQQSAVNGQEGVNAVNDGDTQGGGSEQVVLQVMDWSDSSKAIREQFNKQFVEKYPNIKVQYTQLTIDQFNNTVLTAIQAGEAPDLFPVPSTMKLSTAVAQGWFQPLDDYIDEEFKSAFVDGTFTEGTTVKDGKIYSIPEGQSLPTTLVFYNKKLFKEAGLDPENPPKTYTEFREAAKRITEAGKGSYYGIVEGGKQAGRWTSAIQDGSSLAGSGLTASSPVSLVTNETSYDSKPVTELFRLFQGIAEDGSYHPQTAAITAPEARALFAQGQAGFIVQGAWNVGVWNSNASDLDYGVMAPPLPDSGRVGSLPLYGSQPWIGLSAKSKHPAEAALYLKELYTGGYYQEQFVEKGIGFSVVKGVNENHIKMPQLEKYYEIAKEYGRIVPNPIVRNAQTAEVFAAFKDVHPNAGELLAAVVSGALKDPEASLSKLSGQLGEAWGAAIKTAKAKGTNVSAEDFIFSNWKLLEDYTAEDYQSLP